MGTSMVNEQKQMTAVDTKIAASESSIAASAVELRNIQRDPKSDENRCDKRFAFHSARGHGMRLSVRMHFVANSRRPAR